MSIRRPQIQMWPAPVILAAVVLLAGCAGSTTVVTKPDSGGYDVTMRTDPLTLNPPQSGTLSFEISDASTGKAVTKFEQFEGALMHGIIVGSDLQFYRHAYTNYLIGGQASVSSFFPSAGTYHIFAFYKPAGASTQIFTATISTGTSVAPAEDAVEPADPSRPRSSGDLHVQLLGANGIAAGSDAQLLFHVTHRGQPTADLWPYLGSAGQLWIADQTATSLDIEKGSATARANTSPVPAPSVEAASAGNQPLSGSAAGPGPLGSDASQISTPPALQPDVAHALASVTSLPVGTLVPVQQTAQASVMGTPAVRSDVTFGPDVVFTHRFPHPGRYKMWLEIQFEGRIVTTDYELQVK